MSETNSNKTHLLIGGILLLIGVFVVVALIVVYSQAETDVTTVAVGNANPTVDSYYTNASATYSASDTWATLVLNAGTTKTIYINGVVSDVNGAGDINDVDMKFYREDSGFGCSADANNCYAVDNCTLTSNTSTSKYYSCTADIAYYADSTSANGVAEADIWEAKIIVNDKNSGTGSSTKTNLEVETLLALDIPETGLNYGNMTNNTFTAATNNLEMAVIQHGNDEADVEVSGTIMACSGLGSIPISSQGWALTDVGGDSTSSIALSATATDTNLNVGYRTDGVVSKTLYWNLLVGYDQVGTCTGTNTIAAIAH